MSRMIAHHAQAVLIASWAPTHNASAELQRVAERILVSQRDEIEWVRYWLAEKGEPMLQRTSAPPRIPMPIHEMDHDQLMSGMLTDAQIATLDPARGAAYDTLFLTLMIQHHEGAIPMVNALFDSPGAGQDETVFRFASDVFSDQTTEIARIEAILKARGASATPR